MERQTRRRRRPALSCLECRRRKIKCDRNDPCTHCVSSRNECHYRIYDRAEPGPRDRHPYGGPLTVPPSPSVQPASPPATTAQTATEHAAGSQGLGTIQDTSGRAAVSRNREHESPSRLKDTGPGSLELLQRIRRLEQSSTSNDNSASASSVTSLLARQSGLHDSQVVLKKTRLWRWSDWIGEAEEFKTVYEWYTAYMDAGDGEKETLFQEAGTKTLAVEIGSLVKSCKSLARGLKTGRPSRGLGGSVTSFMPPARCVADTMVNLYLESFESTHRILHIPTFWTEYERYWSHHEAVTADLRLKILLVIGIGSSLHCQGDDDDAGFRNTVLHWVYAAQTWLSGPLEKDRLGITGIQVHCLTIIARQIFSVGGDLVWMSMGSLIHRAMQIGLHRDPKHLPAMSVLQAEMRRRLWATILELVVQSSLDAAMPPRISFDEFDAEPPSNINDDEVDESTVSLESHPKNIHTQTSLQLLLLDCLPVRLRILQLLTGLRSEISYSDVLDLSAELSAACQRNTAFVRENGSSSVSSFHRSLLDYHVRRFMIPLHCPFATKARTSPLFHHSLKTSLDTAMTMTSPNSDRTFNHLMKIGGGMFKEGFRHATATISLEFIALTEAQRLDGTLHCNMPQRELLKSAMRDLIGLSAERIRQGETNIKGHMFLNMIMAQVEAVETGTLGELEGAKRAKESLDFCYTVLQKRAENLPSPWSNGSGVTASGVGEGQEAFGLDWDFDFFLPDGDFS